MPKGMKRKQGGDSAARSKARRCAGPDPKPASMVYSTITKMLSEFAGLGRSAREFNLIVVGSDDDKPGTRNFAVSKERGSLLVATVPCRIRVNGKPQTVNGKPQTQGYLFPGSETKNYGENGGMVNDWLGNQRKTADLIRTVPDFTRLIEEVYGRGFFYTFERFSSRRKDIMQENWSQIIKDAHVDYPNWGKRDGRGLILETVTTPPDFVSFVLLCQSLPHSIPKGGTSPGIYISPKAGDEARKYIENLMEQWRKNYEKATDPKMAHKKVQFWREAVIALGPKPDHAIIIALCMLFGIPPPIYPSGKPVASAPPYASAVYKAFVGEVAPNPKILHCDPGKIIEQMQTHFGAELTAPFKRIAALFPGRKWAMNPAEIYTKDHLAKCLFYGVRM